MNTAADTRNAATARSSAEGMKVEHFGCIMSASEDRFRIFDAREGGGDDRAHTASCRQRGRKASESSVTRTPQKI
jgi:hypothetical protein